jgi:hypothetical protein
MRFVRGATATTFAVDMGSAAWSAASAAEQTAQQVAEPNELSALTAEQAAEKVFQPSCTAPGGRRRRGAATTVAELLR